MSHSPGFQRLSIGPGRILAVRKSTSTLLGLLLFYAKKANVLLWKSPTPPTLEIWKSLINSTLPLCRATYNS